MISFQPVKDKAYTADDLLMKKGYHKMPDESMMKDEDHMIEMNKKGRRAKRRTRSRPTQQIVQKTTVIVNQADAKRRRRRAKPKQKDKNIVFLNRYFLF
jgi:predicted metalloprotease